MAVKRKRSSLLQFGFYEELRRSLVEPLETRVLLSVPTTWTQEGANGGGTYFGPSFNPQNPQEMYVTTDMQPEFHTTNMGNSWSDLNWQNFNGGRPNTISFTNLSSPSSVLYGNSTYPKKSIDAGVTWNAMSGWGSSSAYDVYADPNNSSRVVIATASNIYLSTNGGSSFASEYSGSNLYCAGAFFSTTNNAIYIGTNAGLLLSTSNGAFSLQTALPSGSGAMISFTGAQDPNTGTIRLLCATTSSSIGPGTDPFSAYGGYVGVYTLDVGQSSWTARTSALPSGNQIYLASSAHNDINNLWVAGDNGGSSDTVYRSTNGGVTWSETFQNSKTGYGNNQNIYTGWSGDGGDTNYSWGDYTSGLQADPANASYASITDMGYVYITSDGGATWHAVYETAASQNPAGSVTPKSKFYPNNGLNNTAVHYMTWVDANNIFVGYTDICAARSSDGGATWAIPTSSLLQNTQYKVETAPNGNLYAAASSTHDIFQTWQHSPGSGTGYLLMSTDKGANWSLVHSFGTPIVWEQIDPNNANTMYVSVEGTTSTGGVYKTTNLSAGASATWTQLPAPPRTAGRPYNIRVLNDGSLVVSYSKGDSTLTATSGVFYYNTTNGGTSWSWADRSSSSLDYYTKDVVIDPTDPTQNTWYACVRNGWGGNGNGMGGLYRTTNRGVSWTEIYNASSVDGGIESVTIIPATKEMFVTSEGLGLIYAPDCTVANPAFTSTSYPFIHPYRVFINPYNTSQIWITTYGYSISVGTIATPTSTIAGRAFQDNNADGTFNGSDAGMSGKTVFLDENNNSTLDSGEPSTATDSSGNYTFTGLSSGLSGTVRLQTQPSGFVLDNASSNGFTTTSGSNSTVNLGYFPTAYTGVSGNDNYTLQLDGTGSNINVLIGSTVTYSAAKTLASSLTFNLSAGAGSLTVNEANGNPIQSGGISVTGGASADSLSVTGLSGNNAVTVNGSQVSVNGAAINYSTLAALTINTGNGNDSLTQSAQPGNGASLAFNNGTGSDSLIVTGGTFAIPSNPTGNLSVTIGGGAGASSVSFAGNASGVHGIDAYSLASLTVNGNGTATLIAAVSGLTADRTLLTTNNLSIASGGSVNVTANSIDVNYGSGSDPFSTIRGYVLSGQVTSSLNDSFHAVGYADGVDGIVKSISSGDILIRYTTMGDANLDGTTGFADLSKVAQNYNATNTTWDTGDFMGTGTTGFTDLVKVAQNYTASLGSTQFNAKQAAAKFNKAMAKVHL